MATSLDPQLKALLDRYGLGSLSDWAMLMLESGASDAEIQNALYDRPEFQAAFPEIEARRKQAQKTGVAVSPISPEDILTYRTQARALMRSYGLPSTFYGQNADFFNLIVNDVSTDELNSRLQLAQARVVMAPPEVKSTFSQLTGRSGDDALFAYFVDPAKSLAADTQKVAQAEAGGAAQRFGFDLTPEQMQNIAGHGVDYQQATQGFSDLDTKRSLFDETISETQDLTTETGIEAEFGLAPGAATTVQRRADTRKAETAGGAGGLGEQRGLTGLGGAGRR